MGLSPGTRLGAYEIVGLLGAGGMGEVYRAVDTRLDRHIALKVLPEAVASDPERTARFQREAKVLASLNHPHIAALHGLEDQGGRHFLTMELVEGETLADRIGRGPIPLDEAVPIAKQIAEALEAAHEQGIIHRDLKPANIKVREDGTVKVLDFGLAKALTNESPASNPLLTNSPTITSPIGVTGVGVLLGTAPYMSPEQAKGRPADKRTDIWAFGCVLFEMLVGKRAFEGEDVADTLARVLTAQPDSAALPATTPPAIVALVQQCLQKDQRHRARDIAVALFALGEWVAAAPTDFKRRSPGSRTAVAMTIASLLGAMVAGAIAWRVTPPLTLPVTRFELLLPDAEQFAASAAPRRLLALSPDGSLIAVVTNAGLYIRSLSTGEYTRLVPRDDVVQNPVFSPDGQSIAFFSVADRTIKRIAVTGGAPASLVSTEAPNGITWNEHGITFASQRAGVMRLRLDGSPPETLFTVGSSDLVVQPQLLPGGKAVLFTLANISGALDFDRSRIVVQPLDGGDRRVLLDGGSDARYLPTGHIVYSLGGVLLAAPFDVARFQITGASMPMVEGVARGFGGVGLATSQFSVSDTGTLAYIPGPAATSSGRRTLVSIDSNGTRQPLKIPAGAYLSPRVSPDGRQLAVVLEADTDVSIWIHDLTAPHSFRRLTRENDGKNRFPVWSSDGKRVVFQSDRGGDLGVWWQPADGSAPAERLTTADPEAAHIPESWLPNSQAFYFSLAASSANVSLWTFSVVTKKGEPVNRAQSTSPLDAAVSPDGRWLAYTVRTAGRAAIVVQPIPATGAEYEVASGHHPLWSPDGTQLLFFPGAEQVVGLRIISTRPAFLVAPPEPVAGGFVSNTSRLSGRNHDFMPDGRLVVALTSAELPAGTPSVQHVRVVSNWFRELKRLAASD